MSRTLRRRSLFLIAIYTALWLLTATVGSREIRLLVRTEVEERVGRSLREIPDLSMKQAAYP